MAVGARVSIAGLRPEHSPEAARIYADGIATGDATFETEVPAWERWDAAHLDEHRFVALATDELRRRGRRRGGAVEERLRGRAQGRGGRGHRHLSQRRRRRPRPWLSAARSPRRDIYDASD